MQAIDEQSENEDHDSNRYEQIQINSMNSLRLGKKDKSSKTTAFKEYELAVNPLFSQFYIPDRKNANRESKKDQKDDSLAF